jgi:hypothetical protein
MARRSFDTATKAECVIVAEAADTWRRCSCARLETPDGYSFTAEAATAIAERVRRGDFLAGFQTPAKVYGADFVLRVKGVRREQLARPPSRECPHEVVYQTGRSHIRHGCLTSRMRKTDTVQFILRSDNPEISPPYNFPGINIMSFRLPSTLANLQNLCDQLLNIGSLQDRGFESRLSSTSSIWRS